MLDVICWKWPTADGYRSTFGAAQVNTLRSMVARNYQAPHRFTCFTDDGRGIDGDIRVLPLPTQWGDLPSPHGRGQPSCYRRLWAWSKEARDVIGPRLVSLDLDCVITADMRPVWGRPDECVMWADALNPNNPFNGSMWLLQAGSRAYVWERFKGAESSALARAANYFGSDQAWYAYQLARTRPWDAKTWDRRDGVYSWRVHMAPAAFGGVQMALGERARRHAQGLFVSAQNGRLPLGARIVFFHGAHDPWDARILERFDWVRENYK